MPFDDGHYGEGHRRMTRWERLVVAAVRARPTSRELQGFNHHFCHGLRAEQVHAYVRHLRLIHRAAENVRTDRQPHLYGCTPVVLGRREDVVNDIVVTDQTGIHRLVQGVDGGREAAAHTGDVK